MTPKLERKNLVKIVTTGVLNIRLKAQVWLACFHSSYRDRKNSLDRC